MTEHTPTRCSETIMRDFHSYPCSRKAAITRDGKGYCRQHDPVARKEKSDAAYAKWKTDAELRRKVEAEKRHKINCHDDLVEALEAVMYRPHVDTCSSELGEYQCDCHVNIARKALAKAKVSS